MTTTNPLFNEPAGAPSAAIDFETTKEVGFYGLVWRRFKARKIALVASVTLLAIAIACIAVPLFLPADCVDLSQVPNGNALGPLSVGHSTGSPCVLPGNHFHLLGTDITGRDLLRRNLEGGRISLMIGVLTMTVSIVIATILGALSGFFGGLLDLGVTAITNGVLSIPSILLLIILVRAVNANNDLTVLGLSTTICSIGVIVLAISLIAWPSTARIVRSVILSTREKEFIEAALMTGASDARIIRSHLLPHLVAPIIVYSTLIVAGYILSEAALSFLGVGIKVPTASWGNLLADAPYFYTTVPLLMLWPGIAVVLTTLAFNLLGDGLRDAFDPRSRL